MDMNHPDVEYYPTEVGRTVPFSAAVRVDHMLYLSGQIGIDESGNVVPGGIAAETRQAMDNIRRVLERYGSSMDRLVKVTVTISWSSGVVPRTAQFVTYEIGRAHV